ncbi:MULTISPECIES: hypothetical protein [unclassified Streptomyces]|uniref:hypothetical protein n=1 Tax=unclassified Streptomyces TaxID=2593676 RepID=UPI0033346C87
MPVEGAAGGVVLPPGAKAPLAALPAGVRTVALATTHPAAELDADVVVGHLSAVSVQVSDGRMKVSADVRG